MVGVEIALEHFDDARLAATPISKYTDCQWQHRGVADNVAGGDPRAPALQKFRCPTTFLRLG
jgi:hypothetical protein